MGKIKRHIPWNKGKKLSLEHRKKLSESHKDNIPWNKDDNRIENLACIPHNYHTMIHKIKGGD